MNDTTIPPPDSTGRADPVAAEVARLKREIADRDDLLSIAAHELRNPLHALALHLTLARSMAQSAGAGDTAERIRRAELTLRRYSERVTVLMQLLASPGKAYPFTARPTDVAALLDTLVESLDQEARSRRIEIAVAADGVERGHLRPIDPVALEQVVDNLLLNAFKHSGASAITVRLWSEPACWYVRVEDNGHGIEHADQRAIFEKFAVASHSSRGPGSGLGLWIVTRLVHAMDGAIDLRSEPGEGSAFTVRIPERDAHE